jgi:hypothetical protein
VASTEAISVPFSDTAVSGLERSLAAKAFARLPERWQAVLWHTEIEGLSPADVAPILGLTANGVSALAYRAREGLRQAYLQVHLAESTADRCRATVDRLGAWTRGGLSKRETAQVETHLDECERCRALAAELADVNGALRAVVAPLVLGLAAAGYLATIGASTAKAATVVAAGAAAGTAGAASTAGGTAGAASSVPRQMIGVGASAAALAAVVALALTSGQSQPIIANASPPPPPATAAPSSPTQPPPATQQPPAPTTTPPPPPSSTSPSSPPPAAPPPSTPPTTTTPAPKADLVPSVPGQPISLVPGGPAEELPVTVTNNGNGPSDPVTATLNLPPGVTAVPGGTQSFAARDLLAADGKQSISCTGGIGTISCTTGVGLAPGETVTFRFELTAGPDATGGQITGSIMAGGGMAIQLTNVDVQVRQVDDLDLTAQVWRHDFWSPRVDVSVTNRSTHAGTATVTVNAPRDGWIFTLAPCHQDGEQINCKFDLARGQTTRFGIWVFRWHHRDDALEIAGSLGSAHKVISVPLDCEPGDDLPPLPLPGDPVTPPSSTTLPTIPSTTSKTPTPTPTTKSEPPKQTTKPSTPAQTTTPPVTSTTTPSPTTTSPSPSSTPPPSRTDPGLCLPLLDPRWPLC